MFRTAYREIGLFGLVKRTVNEFLEDDMPTYASALAYQMLFSLFPFLLVLITLVGYLHLPEFFAWLREQAALLLPPEAMDQVNPVIDQLQQQKGGLLSIGIAVALWTSSAGIRSMMIALNAAYDVKESRPVWKRFSLSILYTLGIALLLLVAAGLMVTGPQVIAWIAGLVGLEQYLVTLWTWLRWPLAVFLLMLAVALVLAWAIWRERSGSRRGPRIAPRHAEILGTAVSVAYLPLFLGSCLILLRDRENSPSGHCP